MGFTMGVATLGLKATAAAAAKNPERNGNCRAICCEAGEERYSKTITYDPSRSDLNGHLGKFSSGVDAYEYIREETEKAEAIHRAKSKQGRGFRKDKSIAYAFIFKPDSKWANAQDKATLDRFFDDAFAAARELGVFDENTDVVMRERHYDEAAAHEHTIVMEKSPDGDLAGPEFLGLPKFDVLNHKLPKKLREMGWDIDELERNYDPEEAKDMTPEELAEYKAECIERKRAKHGLSANAYIAKKRAEEARADAEKAIGIAEEATAVADAAEARKSDAEAELAALEPELTRGRAEIAASADAKAKAEAEKKRAEEESAKAKAEAEAAKKERQKMFDDKLAAGRSLTQVKFNVEKREKQLAELDETIAERTAAVQQREAEAARKEAEAERKLKAAQDVIEAAETAINDAQKEADGAFSFVKSYLETRLRKTHAKFLDSMLGWINGAQKAYSERMEAKRQTVTSVRRSVSIAQPRSRSDENGFDF